MIATMEKKIIRCAIYTRKSNEDGLDQAFNSLHAQRAMCESYVASFASEGWTALPTDYNDAGITGGTLERPGLQKLLNDIEAGRVDVVVINTGGLAEGNGRRIPSSGINAVGILRMERGPQRQCTDAVADNDQGHVRGSFVL